MTTENLRAIRAIHARIVPAMISGKGWEEAYRQDVGALLAALDAARADLAALRIEHEAHAALLTATRADRDEAQRSRDHEAGFRAGVEALREQVAAYLLDPAMREAFVLQGPRVIPVLAQVICGFHPGYVKSGAAKVPK